MVWAGAIFMSVLLAGRRDQLRGAEYADREMVAQGRLGGVGVGFASTGNVGCASTGRP